MTQLENFGFAKNNAPDTLADKLSREGSLLAALPHNALEGLKARAEDALDHKLETGAEVVGSLALGAGLAMALRNPETAVYAKFAPWVGSALVAGDAAKRLGSPMVETWNDPISLARNKVRLGANFGAMAFDYTLMGTAGAVGARFGPGLVGLGASRGLPDMAPSSAPSSGMPVMENLGTKEMPAFRVNWPEGVSAADKARFSQDLTSALFANKFEVLTTTRSVGLPMGTSMGLGVASASDLGRSREDTKLGALTNLTPFQANVHEAFQNLKLRSDAVLTNLDGESMTVIDRSQKFLKKLDQK